MEMSSIIAVENQGDPLSHLLLIAILLTALGCSHGIQSNPEEEPEIVSIRNPNVIIQSPVNFAWLPESINSYYLESLAVNQKDIPLQKAIQETISGSLTAHGYTYNGSIYSGKTIITGKGTYTRPEDLILVKNWTWDGANFGATGLLKEVTLDNRGNKDVRDLKIKIGYLGTKGAKEGYWGPTSVFVIHDTLPAKSIKTFRNINIGFRHPDERREDMIVLGVKTVTYDLLIGYTLVTKNTLSNRDIDRAYGITSSQSENDLRKKEEYERGTLIIDAIDAETRVLIWRGALKALPSFDIPEGVKRKRVKLAVERLIDSFITSNQRI